MEVMTTQKLKKMEEDEHPKLEDSSINQENTQSDPEGGYKPFFNNKLKRKLNAMSIVPDALTSVYRRTHLKAYKPYKIKPARSLNIKEASFVPEKGRTIIFQKIKIGDDYCPIQSKDIVGVIENTIGQQTELLIIGGFDEFKEPIGKFSFEDNVEETPNKPFKKIKIGDDYCPIQSKDIVGVIENTIGQETELLIIGGFDEFKEPSGKFSFEDNVEETPNKPFKVKLNNWEILNARFK